MYNTTVISHILSSSHLTIIILIKSQHLSRLVARPQQSKGRPLTSTDFLTESLRRYYPLLTYGPEPEKPRYRISNADRKFFANPESFCVMFIIGWIISR